MEFLEVERPEPEYNYGFIYFHVIKEKSNVVTAFSSLKLI